MKFKFKIQQYQTDAVENVVRVFDGQPNLGLLEYKIDHGKVYVEQGGKRVGRLWHASTCYSRSTTPPRTRRIACAEKLFDQLSTAHVRYGKVDGFETLMQLVNAEIKMQEE